VVYICCYVAVDRKIWHKRGYGSSRAQHVSRSARDESRDVDRATGTRATVSLSKSASSEPSSCVNDVGGSKQRNSDGQCHVARTKIKVEESSVALPLDGRKEKCTETGTESCGIQGSYRRQQPSSRLYQLSVQEIKRDNQATEVRCGSSSHSEDSSSERRSKRCRLSTSGSDLCARRKQSQAGSSYSAAEVMEVCKVTAAELPVRHTDAVSVVTEKQYYLRSVTDSYDAHSRPVNRKTAVAAPSHRKKKSAADNITCDSEMKWNDSEMKGNESKLSSLPQKNSTYTSRSNRGKMKAEGDTRKPGSSRGKDVHQTSQSLLHSDSDQKLSDYCASRGRGKGSYQGKAISFVENQYSIEHGEGKTGDRRSKTGVHEPASWHPSSSYMKKPHNQAVCADKAGGFQQHSKVVQPMRTKHQDTGRPLKPGCRGSRREYSTNTVFEQSDIKKNCEKLNISEDWEAELCETPSVGCNVTVVADSICSDVIDEAFVGKSVEVLTYNSCASADDGSMACNSDKTELLLVPAAGNTDAIIDRQLQQAETSAGDNDIIQDLPISISMKMDNECVGVQTESNTYVSVADFADAEVSQSQETEGSCSPLLDINNQHAYIECEVSVHENDVRQDMDTCEYSVSEDGGQMLSVPLTSESASSDLPSDDAQQSDDEYVTACEVVESELLEADDCFSRPSSEKCADEMSSGKQFFHYFACGWKQIKHTSSTKYRNDMYFSALATSLI